MQATAAAPSTCGGGPACYAEPTVLKSDHWVANYFIDTVEVNRYFGKYLPKEWDSYVGKDAKQQAETFARWVSLRAKAAITFGSFDPVADYFLAR